MQRKGWLDVPVVPTQLQFQLYDCILSYFDVLELFQYFDECYYPHFAIIEPVTSLTELAAESELLFWTIVAVAARHHKRHYIRYPHIQNVHAQLHGKVCREAIQSVPDLQAILMLCTWPYPVKGQFSDPSWMQLGMVITASRLIGLDKAKDEVFFGTRRARHQLGKHAQHTLKLSWLRCFEMDVQMSLWHGNLPILAAPHHLQSTTEFCQDPSIVREYANTIEVHIRTVRYLSLLEDAISPRPSSSLISIWMHELHLVKSVHTSQWSLQNEIVLETAKLYLSMACFVSLTKDTCNTMRRLQPSEAVAQELLHGAQTSAIQLISHITSLSSEAHARSSQHLEQSYPLPGFPKHFSRVLFFAATVLLRYLDSLDSPQSSDGEAARNAFQKVHQFFMSCPRAREHTGAGETLEVAGRAIGHGHTQVHNNVTTRMGASVMYNVIWLGGLLRGRDRDIEYSTNAPVRSQAPERVTRDHAIVAPCVDCLVVHASSQGEATSMDWNAPMQSSAFDAPEFPFGIWDDNIFDKWAGDVMDDSFTDWNVGANQF